VKDAARFGTTTCAPTLDWPTVVRRQHDIVKEFQPLPASLAHAGAEVVVGEARFSDPHTIAVNGSTLWGEKIIIGAGSAPVMPPVPGVDATITSDEVLFLSLLPTRLVIVGAGAIGLEMAGAFSDFGADVTVIGQEGEILPAFDADVAGYVRKILESRGVTFHLGATVTGRSGGLSPRSRLRRQDLEGCQAR
jgi:pyruvate/2-oxoglutarate dehydrogenase complex dihydrolipoamide dehydrogenase (E3) component